VSSRSLLPPQVNRKITNGSNLLLIPARLGDLANSIEDATLVFGVLDRGVCGSCQATGLNLEQKPGDNSQFLGLAWLDMKLRWFMTSEFDSLVFPAWLT
jgi:hypothetical protein